MKRSSFLDNKFRVVFVFRVLLIDEALNRWLLITFHQDFWNRLLNLWPLRKSLTTVFWWKQAISKLPSQEKLALPGVRTNQSHLLWWLSMFLVLRCFCSGWWFCPYSTLQVPVIKTWKQIEVRYTFLLLIFGVSRISRFEVISCIIGFRMLQDFLFCINEKVFLLGHGVFVFVEDNLWAAFANDEASNTRLLKTFHQDFWIWLLNLWPLRKCFTRTIYWCEQGLSNLPSRVRVNQSQPSLMALFYLVLSCCCL